jgi:starch phosphorylase
MFGVTYPIEPYLRRTRIAYFSMEIALRPDIHTYSGGLGVLAGDTARSAADLELPMVFVSLLTRTGYVRQEIDGDGRQTTGPNPWRPQDWATPLDTMAALTIEGREVWVRPWLYRQVTPLGRDIPVLLLDTDLEQNSPADRAITHHLYGGDEAYRLKQEIVLGLGGGRLLQALGFDIATYHLNEGHAALLTLHLLRQVRRLRDGHRTDHPARDIAKVRERCVFTTHTPVEAGTDRFPYDLVVTLVDNLSDYIRMAELRRLAGDDRLNMTRLALSMSGYVNGVSKRHAQTTRHMFPGYDVRAITNGVHAPTWAHASFARLFDEAFPQWALEPEVLERADQLPDEAVWAAHQEAKHGLLACVKELTSIELRPDLPVIGFARRMTEYKRAGLLFDDVERLAEIARRRPFQAVFAGLAHPRDEGGHALIALIHQKMRQLSNAVPMVFLANYNMRIAASLVSGADVWLNTPLPPLEASGTSGMKAALNGVLNLSVLDGWWAEGHIENVTGWGIGNGDGGNDAHRRDADDLYRKLDETVLPLWYDDRPRWIWMMKQSISKLGPCFNSTRMMRRYATEAYLH